jgi:elongator complex protein 3
MRQVVLRHMERLGLKYVEIRRRGVGVRLANWSSVEPGPIEIRRLECEASRGVELFFEAVGPDDTLFGVLRLRMPHAPHRSELAGRTALVRELHIYGPEVPVGERGLWWQHVGLGRALMGRAEEAAREFSASRVAVISGVGARPYFRRLGYGRCGHYMCKALG